MEGTKFKGVEYFKTVPDHIMQRVTSIIAPDYLAFSEDFFEPFALLRRLVLVGHTYKIEPSYSVLRALREKGVALKFVHLNAWSKNYTLANADLDTFDLFAAHHIIHNPVFWDVMKSSTFFDPPNERSDWIFHASFERGGSLSLQVFCQLKPPLAYFHVLDYHYGKNVELSGCPGVVCVGSLSKPPLYDLLSRSKYFVYLLTLPDSGQVHKDMFPTCVLEAIMSGVRVVTLPAGPLVQLFRGLVDFVPIDDHKLAARLLDHSFNTFEPSLLSRNFVDSVASFIQSLESQDFAKERLRRISSARNLYSERAFASKWSLIFDS
jgi:hypothetical protein